MKIKYTNKDNHILKGSIIDVKEFGDKYYLGIWNGVEFKIRKENCEVVE